jgi:murein DD-endopeptidase MepM/ murein hydrolase activator NlpD
VTRLRQALLILSPLLLAAACDRGPLGALFSSPSPYEHYREALRAAGLDSTALGRDWTRVGEQALSRPVAVELPFRETGYFAPHEPAAVGYALQLRRGRRLVIEVQFETEQPARLFVDLFRVRPEDPPDLVESLPVDSTLLEYEVRRDGTYLLRLQPELLRGGRFTLAQRTEASIDFPVPATGMDAVLSRFGAERDAGAREHHGIDIFARRGTPVVAVVDGIARPSTNERGGNVDWLMDASRGRRFYYAHLHEWAIAGTTPVQAGDTLGFIGNTGNARTTPPHLHFGLYEGGPVDPLPFVAPDDPSPRAPVVSLARLAEWVRVSSRRAPLRLGAHRGADTLIPLEAGELAWVSGAARGYYRVRLPDSSVGYLDGSQITPTDRILRREALEPGTVLRAAPRDLAPAIEVLASATSAEVLGRFGAFDLVRLPDARLGWLASGSQP